MQKRSILIIEDEERIAHWLKAYFEREDYVVEVAYDGHTGFRLATESRPDLIVLDLMLPGIDGTTICSRLRQTSDVPIMMLTAKGGAPDRINGLDIGADDYIVKPFDPEEVVARARAVLRRAEGRVRPLVQHGRLTLDETTQVAHLDGRPIQLSQAQIALLGTFMRHPDQVLSREQLISQAFNDHFDGFDRAIDAHIKRLRKLIHTDTFQPLQTVYGAGYKFVSHDSEGKKDC